MSLMKEAEASKSVPKRTKARYEREYALFGQWCRAKSIKMITETVLLDYFTEKSKTKKSSSLWSTYSMLRKTLLEEDNVDISKYPKLHAFLKNEYAIHQADNVPSKSETFSRDEINKFLLEAPDDIYLMTKVALIIGITGACHAEELSKMTIDDIEDNGALLNVSVQDSETQATRVCSFANGDGDWLSVYRKYIGLRSRVTEHRRLLVNYRNGKCLPQPVGRHTVAKFPQRVAEYLKLANVTHYTGRCFRRTSASLLTNSGADVSVLKKFGGFIKEEEKEGEQEEETGQEEEEEQGPQTVPAKSKARYEREYSLFLAWARENNIQTFTEKVILDYFTEKSKTMKSSSLWCTYSILRKMLLVNDNVNISKFVKLLSFIRKAAATEQSVGTCSKSEAFSQKEVNKFLVEAPDDTYLMMKVALIIGIAGACRVEELLKMTIDDVTDDGTLLVISIRDSETQTPRVCSVSNCEGDRLSWLSIYRKYIGLRAAVTEHRRLFVNYKNSKCLTQSVGKNTFGKIPQKIAKYLKLQNVTHYSGVVKYEIEDQEEDQELQTMESVPEKSRARYEREHSLFLEWCQEKDVKTYTENVLLNYFKDKSKTMKSSSLWCTYSMLRKKLLIENNVNISKFMKLLAFLKQEAANQQATNITSKSETFTRQEINTFLLEAPDDIYLVMKIALIIGIAGACRRDELLRMTVDDVEDNGTLLIITIHDSETLTPRVCSVGNGEGDWLSIYRKYARLRAPITEHKRLFVNYKNGKCLTQPVGINTFGKIPQKIAEYLKLPNLSQFTGRCFRRTSAQLLSEAGADILTLKKYGGWHFPST